MKISNARGNQQYRHGILRGAVPVGQHSHHPDQVLPIARVAHTFPDLPTPARRGQRCCQCGGEAALCPPGSQLFYDAYCAVCWLSIAPATEIPE